MTESNEAERMQREVEEMGDPTTKAHIKVGTVQVQRCSACGSDAPHHVAYVRDHGVCVV